MTDIPGFEGIYSISTDGRILNIKKNKFIAYSKTGDGYCVSTLWKDGTRKRLRIHRLIAELFIPNPNLYETVNHINGIKTDNSVENLEWCSVSDNLKHAHKTGLISQKGENSSSVKLNWGQVHEIRSSMLSSSEVAKKYGVSDITIRKIRQFKTWKI